MTKQTIQELTAEIREILWYELGDGLNATDVNEATQALLTIFKDYVEQIIGEDAKHYNGKPMVNPVFTCPDCGSWDEEFVKNALRAEQRKKLEELKK